MQSLKLKYGCNPNQSEASVYMKKGELPFEALNGKPGYINLLDAMNAWQLVRELKEATGLPAAASFKHVSPAGAAVGLPLDDVLSKAYFAPKEVSPVAAAYIRARGADRMSSYGDFAALSDVCDADTANFLKGEVSDGVIAPGYTDEALEILKSKRKGTYLILKMDENYKPEPVEEKEVFGVTFKQSRNEAKITDELLTEIVTKNKNLTQEAKRDLLIALITLKYTQSNSVCYAKGGQAIGIGAGQQSRVHCTRLAGNKADLWHLRQMDKVLNLPFREDVKRPNRDNAIDVYLGDEWEDLLNTDAWKDVFTQKPAPLTREEKRAYLDSVTGVSLASDAFFPFGDNNQALVLMGLIFFHVRFGDRNRFKTSASRVRLLLVGGCGGSGRGFLLSFGGWRIRRVSGLSIKNFINQFLGI